MRAVTSYEPRRVPGCRDMVGTVTVGLFYRQFGLSGTHNDKAGFAGVGVCVRLALTSARETFPDSTASLSPKYQKG